MNFMICCTLKIFRPTANLMILIKKKTRQMLSDPVSRINVIGKVGIKSLTKFEFRYLSDILAKLLTGMLSPSGTYSVKKLRII